jgi:hypothetical protein
MANSLFYLLTELAYDKFQEELEDCKWFAAIIASGINDEEYLRGTEFYWHCTRIRLSPLFVLKAIVEYKRSIT